MKKKRDYTREYKNYQGKKKQKKRRALRNKARRKALRTGRAKKHDGKDIHHKGSLRNTKNTVVKKAKNNRSFPRRSDHTEIKRRSGKKK